MQIYFWAWVEPESWLFVAAIAAPLLIWASLWRRLRRYWLLGLTLFLIGLGFAAAGVRAAWVAAPVLETSLDATIEGRVVSVNRSQTGRPRVVLEDLVIYGVGDQRTPSRAQITLRVVDDMTRLKPGAVVSVFAHLGPPGRPVEPGGFDFRRTAWFQSLGAIGYANGALAFIEGEDIAAMSLPRRMAATLAGWRASISASLRQQMPGETGAIAAAVTVGDRGGVSPETLDDLRRSNLAHLLAISGLHMGLVTALIFGGARLLLAAIPATGRRWRTKQIAAWLALLGALAYLAISGGSIATQRAFVMAAVALGAIIMNRPAITLRALATAALIILLLRPESLMHVGFQMSFAATTGIVASYELVRARGWSQWFKQGGRGRAVLGYVVGLAGTSLVAGLATAPFSAFHFNQMAHYGLIANLAAVPVMGFWVAPAGLVAAFLAPFGAEGPALAVMGAGIEAILAVAKGVSGLSGSARLVAAGPDVALALIVLGGLMLTIMRSRLRVVGAGVVAIALVVWLVASPRPAVLIAENAGLIGVMTPAGRALDHKSAESYAARQWLRRDGDQSEQSAASNRGEFKRSKTSVETRLSNDWRVISTRGSRLELHELVALCQEKVLLLSRRASTPVAGPCRMLHQAPLSDMGALAVEPHGDGIIIRSAAQMAGKRYWTGYRPGGAEAD
ncbi:MAG: ComEC/Rec2 family competence protein [Pikeienuella sp.]